MEGGMLFQRSNLPVLLHNDRLPSSEVLDSLWISNHSSSFHGSTSMVNFDASQEDHKNMITQFFSPLDSEENVDEDYDRSSYRPEKKRRLTVDQVQFLERSFEVENKLEPDRKIQLAKELDMQPRQVAIWFQNRRARYKSKQIEKDYDVLKASYDKLKVDCDSLHQENEKLKQEVLRLSDKHGPISNSGPTPINLNELDQRLAEITNTSHQLFGSVVDPTSNRGGLYKPHSRWINGYYRVHLLKEKVVQKEQGGIGSKECEMINLKDTESPKPISILESINAITVEPNVVCKIEDANSAKSDVFESEGDSCHVFEREQSDFEEEDDNLSWSLLRPPRFPKLEEGSYIDASENSCNLGYAVEDQSFWFWAN